VIEKVGHITPRSPKNFTKQNEGIHPLLSSFPSVQSQSAFICGYKLFPRLKIRVHLCSSVVKNLCFLSNYFCSIRAAVIVRIGRREFAGDH